MSRVRKMWDVLSRIVLSASAGAVVAIMITAFVGAALSYYPPDDEAGGQLFLAVAGAGGTAGAVLAAVAGTRQVRGRARDVIVGTLSGCVLGVLGGLLYAAAASGVSPNFMTGKFEAVDRLTGLIVGVPSGCALGGIIGFGIGALQRRGNRGCP